MASELFKKQEGMKTIPVLRVAGFLYILHNGGHMPITSTSWLLKCRVFCCTYMRSSEPLGAHPPVVRAGIQWGCLDFRRLLNKDLGFKQKTQRGAECIIVLDVPLSSLYLPFPSRIFASGQADPHGDITSLPYNPFLIQKVLFQTDVSSAGEQRERESKLSRASLCTHSKLSDFHLMCFIPNERERKKNQTPQVGNFPSLSERGRKWAATPNGSTDRVRSRNSSSERAGRDARPEATL